MDLIHFQVVQELGEMLFQDLQEVQVQILFL